jgi:hypothetical protein
MKSLILLIFSLGMFAILSSPSYGSGSDSIEVRVSESDLKKMAQFEKDHADAARANADKALSLSEKKMKKAEVKQ